MEGKGVRARLWTLLVFNPKPSVTSGVCKCTRIKGWEASLPEERVVVFQDIKRPEKTLDFNRAKVD